MKYIIQLTFFISLLFFCLFFNAQSQDRPKEKRGNLHQKIDRAYQQGDINLDQRVLYKFFPDDARAKLPDGESINFDTPLKCGTPATSDFYRNKNKLSPATIRQIESLLGQPTQQASQTHTSESGRFTIHYETSGSNAVPPEDENGNGVPDYVDEVATAADSSYQHEVERIGYTNPIAPNQSYDIYLLNLEDVYGRTVAPGDGSTYIEIENDFAEGFPSNDDPEGDQIGAIKVTVAHEFKHAIQYEANEWQGETGFWLEMDATLMEEVVYDNVNDYYNYINSESSIFNNPDGGFYPGSYADITWALFFEEKFGPTFWVDTWQTIAENPSISMVNAITTQLGGSESFNRNFIESQLWHYASGNNYSGGFGFEEAEFYPTPRITNSFTGDTQLPQADTLNTLSAQYFEVDSSPFPGEVEFILTELMSPNAGMGVLVYLEEGGVEPVFLYNSQQESVFRKSDLRWENIQKLGVVTTNGSYQQQTKYAFGIRSIEPQVVRVEQNYPNPFRGQTNIRYSIPSRAYVKLEIYDTLGRKVSTLVNRSQPEGIYTEKFDGSNYASGIYFYRLIIDGEVTTKKMTLIK